MPKIVFNSWKHVVEFHSPLKNGELDSQTIEVRQDPLTGHQSVLNEALQGQGLLCFPGNRFEYLRQRMADTVEGASCAGASGAPSPPGIPNGCFREAGCKKAKRFCFPNLFPLAAYHAVVMVGEKHGRTLDEFSPSLLFDALSVSLEFIGRCFESDPGTPYFTINANFMPPAGSSIMHPHFQILGSPLPSSSSPGAAGKQPRLPAGHRLLLLDRSGRNRKGIRDKDGLAKWAKAAGLPRSP